MFQTFLQWKILQCILHSLCGHEFRGDWAEWFWLWVSPEVQPEVSRGYSFLKAWWQLQNVSKVAQSYDYLGRGLRQWQVSVPHHRGLSIGVGWGGGWLLSSWDDSWLSPSKWSKTPGKCLLWLTLDTIHHLQHPAGRRSRPSQYWVGLRKRTNTRR